MAKYVPPHLRGSSGSFPAPTQQLPGGRPARPSPERVGLALLCGASLAAQCSDFIERTRRIPDMTGRADALIVIDSAALTTAAAGNDAATFAALAELIPSRALSKSQEVVPSSGAGVNREFLTHFLVPHASALAVSGAVLLSIVEIAVKKNPLYPNCDVVGFAAMGHVSARDKSAATSTADASPLSAESLTAAHELLEEAGISFGAADWAALLDDATAPLPKGVPRFTHVKMSAVTGGDLKIIAVCVPASWVAYEDMIDATGKPETLSAAACVDKPAVHKGYPCVVIRP